MFNLGYQHVIWQRKLLLSPLPLVWKFLKLFCVTLALPGNTCSWWWKLVVPQPSSGLLWVSIPSFSTCSPEHPLLWPQQPLWVFVPRVHHFYLMSCSPGFTGHSTATRMATLVTLVRKYQQQLLPVCREQYGILKSQLRHLTISVNLVRVLDFSKLRHPHQKS